MAERNGIRAFSMNSYHESNRVLQLLQNAWHPAESAWSNFPKSQPNSNYEISMIDTFRNGVPSQIYEMYERYCLDLGNGFEECDDIFIDSLRLVAETDIRSFCNATDMTSDRAQIFALQALQRTSEALDSLAYRKTVNSSVPIATPIVNSDTEDLFDIPFCKGALLLHEQAANISDIALDPRNTLFTCKYCYMDVGNFPNLSNLPTTSRSRQIISCHVTACASFSDRRTAYRCIFCHNEGICFFTTSGIDLAAHLKECSAQKMTMNQVSTPVPQSPRTASENPFNRNLSNGETRTAVDHVHVYSTGTDPNRSATWESPVRPDQPFAGQNPESKASKHSEPDASSITSADRLATRSKPISITSGAVDSKQINPVRDYNSNAPLATPNRRQEQYSNDYPSTAPVIASVPPVRAVKPQIEDPPVPPKPLQRPIARKAVVNSDLVFNNPPSDYAYTSDTQPSVSVPSSTRSSFDDNSIKLLRHMGIPDAQARALLTSTGGNVQQAAELYLDSEDANPPTPVRQSQEGLSRSNRGITPSGNTPTRPPRRRGGFGN